VREQRRIAEEARESKVVLFVVVFYDNVGGFFALTVCLILLQMNDARIFAKQSAEKAEEARIALEKKEESHVAELETKDAAARAKEADLLAQLEKTRHSARELLASKDSEAVAERKEHAAELERRSTALEAEFQCRICLKNEEFGILEQEYYIDLSTRDAELLKLSAKLDEEKTLTKNKNAELQSEKSKAEKLELDLTEVKQELEKAKADLKRLETSAADAEAKHTAALSAKDGIHTTLLQNANAELQSEKSKVENLESDLREAKTKIQNANTALLIEKIQVESVLNEARTKYTDAERKATEAEATHTAALTAIKAVKDQELAHILGPTTRFVPMSL
jgi:DNA repair exonuclease SbcCD ATPase subunit